MKPKIRIDVVSDVVCPWCYIGKRRLESAMERLSGEFEFEVTYQPFELNPEMPTAGLDQRAYLTEKFGGVERYRHLTTRVKEVAALEGITFDYDSQQISPNTRRLHVLIEFAGAKGLQREMVEVLFNAYFTSGIDLSKEDNIVKAALECGLNETEVRQALNDERRLTGIGIAEQELQRLGISGVPFFIINKKYGISGAQPAEIFEETLRDIGREKISEGEVCNAESKNC